MERQYTQAGTGVTWVSLRGMLTQCLSAAPALFRLRWPLLSIPIFRMQGFALAPRMVLVQPVQHHHFPVRSVRSVRLQLLGGCPALVYLRSMTTAGAFTAMPGGQRLCTGGNTCTLQVQAPLPNNK